MPVTPVFLCSIKRLNCIRWVKHHLEYGNIGPYLQGLPTIVVVQVYLGNESFIVEQLLPWMPLLSGCYWLDELDTDSS